MKKFRNFKIFAFVACLVLSIFVGLSFHASSLFAGYTGIVYEQYEEPDVVSVKDISNKNKLELKSNNRYTYSKTAANGSVVFKFILEANQWDEAANMQIYLMLDEPTYSGDAWWNSGNYFWIQYQNIYMMQQDSKGNRFNSRNNSVTQGNHLFEVGRIATKESNGEFIGNYYCFIKCDGTVIDECINYFEPSTLMNQFHITGRENNSNKLIDANWTGNKVTFVSNKLVVDEYKTTDVKISKPTDPYVPGKSFIGWFDELGNEWDFETDEVLADMVLTAGFSSEGGSTVDDETYFDDSTFTPNLRFLVSSDVHIGQSSSIRNTRLAKAFDVAYRYADDSLTYNNLDAALFAGDVSDDGSPVALSSFNTTVNNNVREGTQVIVSMGNHEFRTYDSATRQIKAFEEALNTKCDTHVVINGYHFIALSPNLNEGHNFSQAKVDWLEEQLAIAAADTPNKPIFVQQHEGIRGTIYGSKDWGCDELTSVLCKYPQVVDFSGHSHFPLADPRSIWQGTFTALGTGTLHFYEMGINGYKSSGVFPSDTNGGWSSAFASAASTAEFQIVEIDANNAMRVIVYDLNNDREITRYYMRNLTDERKIKYSHTERSKSAEKPYFDNSTVANVKVDENAVTVSFDQAKCADTVESYRIELYKKKKLVQTEYALSDYFFDPVPENIKVDIRNLDENTDYTVKIYAVNVWNMECDKPLETSFKTGNVTVYEDVVDEITLSDLYSGSTQMSPTKLNSYKPVSFKKSENNVYGSFKLRMQLLYVDGDFQVGFDEEFDNNDLVWINNGNNIWFIKENYKSSKPLEPGLHTVEYGRYHLVEGKKSYTVFYVKFDDDPDYYHEYKSTEIFKTDGNLILNFNSCYAAGSRYYDIDYVVPREETPTFEKGKNIELTSPMSEWLDLGGALVFDSKSKTLDAWLEDEYGRVTNNLTFNGSFVLGDNGDYYHYEIKTNKFDLAVGATGKESIYKICFANENWEYGNLNIVYYEKEVLAQYDEISIKDVANYTETGLVSYSGVETGLSYNGTSPTYSAVLKYYLVTDDLNTSTSEFRSQLGTLWSYYCTLWLQPGNSSTGFFGFQYTTRPTDRYTIDLKSRSIYLVETGTIRVEKGEYAGWNYTYFKINDDVISSFYVRASECESTSYQVAFKVIDGYTAADISLARNIEYIVDGKSYAKKLAISGTKIYEPDTPKKAGAYFTGWYTKPEGGERIDFSKVFTSKEMNVKYYAQYSTDLCDVTFYSEGETYQVQEVGRGGLALEPDAPVKTGKYKYSFVKWVYKGTDTEFNFSEKIPGDLELEAVFEEYKYRIVYKNDGKDVYTRYYLESDPTTIIGEEPEVPTYLGSTGYWDYAVESRTLGDTYAIARFNGVDIEDSNTISLNKFNGKKVDIADELTRYYLSFEDTTEQAKWLRDYPVSGGHERQDITFSWTDTAGNSNFVVYFADNKNFNNAFVVRTKATTLTDVGIFTPGNTYYWKVVSEKTKKESEVDTFTVLNTTVRWISAGPVFNVRDLGGWTTIDGKEVKYGMFYRGGQLSLDLSGESSYMNDYSHKVFDYLGIKTEIELRGEATHTINQFNEFEKMIFVSGTGYSPAIFNMSAKHAEAYRNVITEMADESNYPFYFHCSWGADRTGTLAFFINGLLGVPYEQLAEDYELTSLSYSGRRSRIIDGFDKMYNDLYERYGTGGTFKEAMNNYIVNYLGVKQSDVDKIRKLMLVDATEQAITHKVTYRIDGEVYLTSKVFDGGNVSSVAPVFFDRHVGGWLCNGEIYDLNKPVTEDLVLDAVYEETLYEDYDLITVRDLGLGDSFIPHEGEPYKYEGYSANGSRIYEFDYEIATETGSFDDGVHVEIGNVLWAFKAHLWIAGSDSQHVFLDGTGTPALTLKYRFEYGKTYRVQVGVVYPINGPYAGKKLFVVLVDGELLCQLECSADLTSGKCIGMAGTQGILHSTDNLRTVSFRDENGEVIKEVNVTRGTKTSEIATPEAPLNKKFVGWYDELGNKWNFDTDLVLKDQILFARFGDVTTSALVLDNNDYEIINNYEVIVGNKVSSLEVPTVKDTLKFVGWYDGETKLSDSDTITEGMNLICRFEVIEKEPDNPDDPVDPIDPDKPTKKGCKSSAGFGFITLISLAGVLALKKRRSWGN